MAINVSAAEAQIASDFCGFHRDATLTGVTGGTSIGPTLGMNGIQYDSDIDSVPNQGMRKLVLSLIRARIWYPDVAQMIASAIDTVEGAAVVTHVTEGNGLSLTLGDLAMAAASSTESGAVTTGAQTFAGNKIFTGTISASNLSGTNTGDVSFTAVGTTPNANAASTAGQVVTLQPASGAYPGVMVAADYTLLHNQSGVNTGDVSFAAVGAAPNANAASIAGQVVTLQPANGTYAGLLTATNYTKLTSLASIYSIGTGLSLVSNTLNNSSPLTSLTIDTFDIAGGQAKALYFDGTNKLSISAATDSTPGAISLSDQIMGLGVKTFLVSGNNTVLATLSTNETQIVNSGIESTAAPVLKLISDKFPVGQFYSTRLGNAVVEGKTDLTLKAAATDSFSVDGSGFVTVLGGTGGVPGINMGTSAIQYVSGTPGSFQFNSDGYMDYTADILASGFGFHRWNTNGGSTMQLTATALSPSTAAGISLGTSALPWGQPFFQVTGTNTTLGTLSTNEIRLNNPTASGFSWLKFLFSGTAKAQIGVDSGGTVNIDSGAHINYDTGSTSFVHYWTFNGSERMRLTSTALVPGTAAGTTIGTSALPWGQPFLQLTGTNYFLGTSSTNEVRLINTNTGTGQTGIKFYYSATPKGQLFCDPNGTMFMDTVATGTNSYRFCSGGTSAAQGTVVLGLGGGRANVNAKPVYKMGSVTGNGTTQASGTVLSLTDDNAAYTVTNGAGNNAVTLPNADVGTVIWLYFSAANGPVFPHSGGQFCGAATNASITTTKFQMQVIKLSSTQWGYVL